MEKDTRSVIDRLDDIEETVKKDEEPKSISDMIGEDFGEYLKTSTLYYYEPDERKFNNHIKKQKSRLIIYILFISIALIVDLICSFWANRLWIYFYLSDFLLILTPIFYLIYTLKQKNKQIAYSKWNLKNHEFYTYENKIGEESSKGRIHYFLLSYKIITFVLFVASFFTMFINGKFTDEVTIVFAIRTVCGSFILGVYLPLSYSEYYYSYYIFDNKNSYVVKDAHWNFTKYNK